jgi:zinc/manganese transport system substrate-binding protein
VTRTIALTAALLLALPLAACGSDDADAGGRPTVVVTTTILGDVVEHLVGDGADVEVLMPRGADPHDVQLSARQAADVREADALVTNGAGFEAGFADALAAATADGVPTHAAIDDVATLVLGEDAHAHEHAGEDEEHGDSEEVDPHFFTDPDRTADAAEGIAAFLEAEVPGLATDDGYVAELRALADEVEATLAPIPEADRVLVTNHEVFGYFADRYGFEVVGAVVPGGGTGAEPDAAALDELATVIRDEGVPAIFADTSAPQDLADALAAEVGDVEVVALFTESLGEPGSGGATYEEMVRTNAERIAGALGGR